MTNKWQPVLFLSFLLNLFLVAVIFSRIDIPLLSKAPTATNTNVNTKVTAASSISKDNIFKEINPDSGFEINASYADLGPKMINIGVIDPTKFRSVFQRSGQSLTPEQEKILRSGSTEKIKITADNSYFLLNFFWAVGLANKTEILTSGDMVKYGGEKDLGNFASTGGWTLGASDAMKYYSQSVLIALTPEQESLVAKVAGNIYRPCCNNSTAFPDCNHGMALLGVLELMAAKGGTEAQMYEAAKYFNAFWFPGSYYDLATYFKDKEGKSFKDIDAKVLLSKDYSSASGWQLAKKWLVDQGLVSEPPKQGGGCGV